MKYELWKILLIIGVMLNIIAYLFGGKPECFDAAGFLSIIYVIFVLDEKNNKNKVL